MAEELIGSTSVRVRFAPSPTGSLHIGGARTALFNWLFARKHNGKFILRIEDTDQARSTRESEEGILRDFCWFGLDWDEGPDPERWPEHKGDKGPYRQTDRGIIYDEWAKKLLQLPGRRVYWCVCLEEELEAKRKATLARGETPRYDGTCYNRSEEELKKNMEADSRRRRALRFHVPEDRGTIVVHDLVKGDVEFDSKTIGDFVILKSHTLPAVADQVNKILSKEPLFIPSYNFACVIDDHLMDITHVIRGDEHLVNTPRQLMLYEALAWEPPKFAHLSMILAPDHSKLSKRHGTTAVQEFIDQGFLPNALLNYVALLGWSPGTTQEIWPREELVKEFSLDRISKNPAVFDINKLKWFNAQYIRDLSSDDLRKQIKNISETDIKAIYLPAITHVAKKYVEAFENEKWKPENDTILEHIILGTREKPVLLNDIPNEVKDLAGEPVFEDYAKELLLQNGSAEVLEAFLDCLNIYDISTTDGFKACIKEVQNKTGRKGKDLYMPIRAAITGKLHGAELIHIMPVQIARYGKDGIANRVRNSLAQYMKG